jgi:cytosine/adenosine deaminase-related metal-dependent hydrolase
VSRASTAVALVNARIDGTLCVLRLQGGHIVELSDTPGTGDTIIDVDGDRVLPGLINAHDHLQLNVYPRQKHRERYTNVVGWIDDINARRAGDPALVADRHTRAARLAHGGLKNLLSGVTTVAHHDPLYESVCDCDFPVRVVREYGWSHSLAIDGAANVQRSYRATPREQPWIIHAAEGVDDAARAEFDTLKSLGCIAANTVLVHGVALDAAHRARLASVGGGLIWCPSSNLHLFGSTATLDELVAARAVALGTDSRLSGARDLLAELAIAQRASQQSEATLERMVTSWAAQLLRVTDRGAIRAGALADLIVLPASLALHEATRADVKMVMIDGAMRYGDLRYARQLTEDRSWQPLEVDGCDKVLERAVADALLRYRVDEPGVRLNARATRAA